MRLDALLIAALLGLAIGGERFTEADILDARAVPEVGGGAGIMITFTPAAAKRVEALTAAQVGKPVAVMLDGTQLSAPVVRDPIRDGVVQISGEPDLATAQAIAKRISGKDPLPDALDE